MDEQIVNQIRESQQRAAAILERMREVHAELLAEAKVVQDLEAQLPIWTIRFLNEDTLRWDAHRDLTSAQVDEIAAGLGENTSYDISSRTMGWNSLSFQVPNFRCHDREGGGVRCDGLNYHLTGHFIAHINAH